MPEDLREDAAEVTGMCPHCGVIVVVERGLTTVHLEGHGVVLLGEVETFPDTETVLVPGTNSVVIQHPCPGSEQNPRCAESDGRPLWNGEANPHYYRNQAVDIGRTGRS